MSPSSLEQRLQELREELAATNQEIKHLNNEVARYNFERNRALAKAASLAREMRQLEVWLAHKRQAEADRRTNAMREGDLKR